VATSPILVAGGDRQARARLRAWLEGDAHGVREADSVEAAVAEAGRQRLALVLVDLAGFRAEGFELCMRLRALETASAVPILMLGQTDDSTDRVVGLELGIDGFVDSPCSRRELEAQVRAIMRRRAAENAAATEAFERGWLRIDFGSREVFVDGKRADVTLRDFELLAFFVRHPHRVYRRQELLDLVWGPGADVEPRTIDAHILRLRKRLAPPNNGPRLFVTVRGVGYRFNTDALADHRLPAREA
jgi:DNA-binding response OmpR family regulator